MLLKSDWLSFVRRMFSTRGSASRRRARVVVRPVPCLGSVERLEDRALLAAFTAGNVVVYRVGTGSGDLVNTGNPVFLDEYDANGILVQSVPLPATDPDGIGPNRALIASGTATSEGGLSLSADGRYLVATGYASTGTGVASSSINRVVGRIDAAGTVDTTTFITDATGNNIRSATSTDGTEFWIGTAGGGVRYVTLGNSTASTSLGTLNNTRWVQIFGGQLYGNCSITPRSARGPAALVAGVD